MRFPFRPFEVEPTPAHPSPTIWRPVVPIRVSGPTTTIRLFGLLDTGADESTLPMNVATRLGIELNPDEPARFRGTGGQQAKGFYSKQVGFELRQGKQSFRWVISKIAFLYVPPDANGGEMITITLGHVGFFRYFNVTFDNQRFRVEIRPNGLFHRHRTE